MNRQAVIEATIDYVITKLKAGRSVGPSWVNQQERELHNAPRYMKMPKLIEADEKKFDANKRQIIYKPNPNSLKPKWNLKKFDPNKRQLMKKLSEEANPKRLPGSLPSGLKAKILKFKPRPKHVQTRAQLTDKIVKKHTASSSSGKVKATYTKLPTQVAIEKKKPLGTHLAKHAIHREMVKRARGKSKLPEWIAEEMSKHGALAKKAAKKVLPWSMTRWMGGTKRNKELAAKYPNVVKAGEASARIRASKHSVLTTQKKVGRDTFQDFAASANMSRRDLKHMYKRSARKGRLHVPRDMK